MATQPSAYGAGRREEAGRGIWAVGLVLFAAVFMIVGGIFHAIQGLAAVIDDQFFVVVNNYAYDLDVSTWGWIHLFGGIIVALAGFALFSGAVWARILAVLLVMGSAVVNFMYIPYFPLWSIVLLVIDGAIIWALLTYGEFFEEA